MVANARYAGFMYALQVQTRRDAKPGLHGACRSTAKDERTKTMMQGCNDIMMVKTLHIEQGGSVSKLVDGELKSKAESTKQHQLERHVDRGAHLSGRLVSRNDCG